MKKKKAVFHGWMTEDMNPQWHGRGKEKRLLIPPIINLNWRKGRKHGMGLTPPSAPRQVTVTFEWTEEE